MPGSWQRSLNLGYKVRKVAWLHPIWPNYSDLSEVTEINFEIDDLACSCHSWFRSNGKKTFGGPNSFFHRPVPVIYSNPWPHKSRQNFPGPQKFFSTILSQSHVRTPDPTKADKTFRRPKSYFPRSCPSHIFEPLTPQKPTKLSGAPKVFFHDPVPVTCSNPWPHKSRQNFPAPQKLFSTILSQSHIRTPDPTKADKTFRGPKSSSVHAHTHWDKHPPPNPTSRPG